MILRVTLGLILLLALLAFGYFLYAAYVQNPRVERELLDDPQGERAERVMLITLPSGRRIPVNYYREPGVVFAGADGSWWKELVGDGTAVQVWIRGETRSGVARAIRDDPAYTERVFSKLRPTAVKGFGTLIEIKLAEPPAG